MVKYPEIQSEFMVTFIKDTWKITKSLAKTLKKLGITFTYIGGIAKLQYGAIETTDNIDILVAAEDREKIIKEFLSEKTFMYNGIEVHVLYEGTISGDGINGLKYLNPRMVTNNIKGVPFITLKRLIEYKLSSGLYGRRLKDFTDIIMLILVNKLHMGYANHFRYDLRDRYVEIWNEAHYVVEGI